MRQIEVDYSQLGVLSACHFVAHFDRCDLVGLRYVSDYRASLEGEPVEVNCLAYFNKESFGITSFDYAVYSLSSEVEILPFGSKAQGQARALHLINSYLTVLLP